MQNLVKLLQRERPQHTGDVASARALWLSYRLANGRTAPAPLLSPPSYNAKFAKTERHDHVFVYGLSLAPDKSSGTHLVCPHSTPQCRRACVAFAGKGGLASVQAGRTLRTQFLAEHPHECVTLLHHEIHLAAQAHGDALRVRLNAFSDIPWESVAPWVFNHDRPTRFYDYTKWPFGTRTLASNYKLTYSVSERFDPTIPHDRWLAEGFDHPRLRDHNFAVVFDVRKGQPLPETYLGRRVIDGDHSDDRWSDPLGVIVGLRAKGPARNLRVGGFVKEAA